MFWGLRLLTTHSLKRLYYSFTQEAFIGHLLCAKTMLGTGTQRCVGPMRSLSWEEVRKCTAERMSKKIPVTRAMKNERGAVLRVSGRSGLSEEVTWRSSTGRGWGLRSRRPHGRGRGPEVGPLARRLRTTVRRPLQEGLWPEGTLSPSSQGWRPRGRAWARLEEMGPRPRRADSPGTANIPSASDETQSR